MIWFVQTFRSYPELALFLTLALGFWLGKLRIGQFELGSVTGTLLAGILIGQMRIEIDSQMRSFFFLMFLFAVGYGVGPQFVRGLKKDGIPQLIFSVSQCGVSLAVAYLLARVLGYDLGQAAGVFAGSHTVTAAMGVAVDSIAGLALPISEKEFALKHLPVAYAVTYIFGTAGAAWFLSSIGPKILGVNLPAECQKMEMNTNNSDGDSGFLSLAERFDLRAYRLENERLHGKTIGEFEILFGQARVFVECMRRKGSVVHFNLSTVLERGDILGVMARREMHLNNSLDIGPEVADPDLLDVTVEVLEVVVINKEVAGITLKELAWSPLGRSQTRGVFLRKLVRGGIEIPISEDVVIDRGDVFQLIGSKGNLDRVASYLGYADRPTEMTDMIFVGSGIVIGGLLGAITLRVNNFPLQLSTSVGALLAGLIFGWLRSVKRTFGRIPAPALWILQNLGLTAFIAALGISVGPSFVVGIKESGVNMFVAGIFASTLPLIFGILMGKYVFKFHPAITLGATAGAQTSSASLAMIQNAANSKVPAMGYSVPYAVANILLTLWGAVIVWLLS
ncbi:MAG: Aspartate/alanine antiporter [Elusimicrobia bacterium]|nr:Aspartate/alanine antiporter [Elusimicrobiota bacterium]